MCVCADSWDFPISGFLYAERLTEPVAGRIMASPLCNLHFQSGPTLRGSHWDFHADRVSKQLSVLLKSDVADLERGLTSANKNHPREAFNCRLQSKVTWICHLRSIKSAHSVRRLSDADTLRRGVWLAAKLMDIFTANRKIGNINATLETQEESDSRNWFGLSCSATKQHLLHFRFFF